MVPLQLHTEDVFTDQKLLKIVSSDARVQLQSEVKLGRVLGESCAGCRAQEVGLCSALHQRCALSQICSPAPFGLRLGSVWAPFGLLLGSVWAPFGLRLNIKQRS